MREGVGKRAALTVLGSGTNVPYVRRGPSGYALAVDGAVVLLDGGSGTVGRMARFGVDFRAVTGLFYTHTHADHTGDLVPFVFALNYTPGYRRTEPLAIYGPRGMREFVGRLEAAWPSMRPKDYEITVTELDGEDITFHDLCVETRPMRHNEDIRSIGYRFTAGARSVAYSGDTRHCAELVELARGADLLVIEASFPTEKLKLGAHLSAEEAGRVAREAGVKRVVLTHLYPVCDEYDMRLLCRREFQGDIRVAEDGDTYPV